MEKLDKKEIKLRKHLKKLWKDYTKDNVHYDFATLLKQLYFKPQEIVIQGRKKSITPIEIALRKQRDKAMQGDIKAAKFIYDELQSITGKRFQKPVFIIHDVPRPEPDNSYLTQRNNASARKRK